MQNILSTTIMSSRVRLARNVKNVSFPNQIKAVDKNIFSFMQTAKDLLQSREKYDFLLMSDLTLSQKEILIERHLISPCLAKNDLCGAVMLSNDRKVSIMFNEEDHFRLQCISDGFDLVTPLQRLNKIDNLLIDNLDIAYKDDLGFLTSCLTNVGTGLRASVMMFLPALTKLNRISKVIKTLSAAKIEIRGMWGEGSKANAYMYQISNKLSLGYSENRLICAVNDAVVDLASAEIQAREILYKDKATILDESLRAYGTLVYAYKLTVEELFECFANIKLGAYYDIFAIYDENAFNDLLVSCLEGNIYEREKDSGIDIDILRARYVKKTITQICKVL